MGGMDERAGKVVAELHARMSVENVRRGEVDESLPNWRDDFMLAVGPESGELLNLLVRSLKQPKVLELGTSVGYSTVWLADAARASGGNVTTIERVAHKTAQARETVGKAGLAEFVTFETGDALELLSAPGAWDFVLVDLWKDLYLSCLELFYPKLTPGAIVVADNMLAPGGENAERYMKAVRSMPGMRSLLLPVGMGLEISRRD